MKKLIFIGLLSFLFAAIWLTPLAFVLPHIEKVAPTIKAFEPKGTLWDGNINHLSVNGHYLGKASWKVDIIDSLKSLALMSKFKLNSEDINAYGIVGLNTQQQLILENTRFDINASHLNKLQTVATLSGTFNGFIKQGLLQQQSIPIIDGTVDWQNGALSSPLTLSEGDYQAVLKPVDTHLAINLSSKEAPIELNGDIQLQNDWTYTTNVKTKSSSAALTSMMRLAGKPQTDGTILINQKGDLKPILNLQ